MRVLGVEVLRCWSISDPRSHGSLLVVGAMVFQAVDHKFKPRLAPNSLNKQGDSQKVRDLKTGVRATRRTFRKAKKLQSQVWCQVAAVIILTNTILFFIFLFLSSNNKSWWMILSMGSLKIAQLNERYRIHSSKHNILLPLITCNVMWSQWRKLTSLVWHKMLVLLYW